MNFIRKFSTSCIKTITHHTSNAFLRKQVQGSYLTYKNICRLNSSFASSTPQSQFSSQEPTSEDDNEISNEVLSKINTQIKENSHSRLFAMIRLGNRTFKITTEDIIAVDSFFVPNVGDRICLEKVLLVGSTDFTLIGRPVLNPDLLRIEATVIEKTYIVPRPIYRHGRLRYRRLHWFRTPYTLIRINSIDFKHSLDELPDVQGIQNRVIY